MIKYINKRLLKDFLLHGFATYGALWVVAESVGAFFPDVKPEGFGWYAALMVISVARGLWACWPTPRIIFDIPSSDSAFEIRFGDIFKADSVVVIPANEYFDGLLGKHVSEKSLHGQFIKVVLSGECDLFIKRINRSLRSLSVSGVHVERESGQCTQYPIGTVACLDVNDKRFLFAALSKTDLQTLKASATADQLSKCLAGIWNGARDHSNGNPVSLPLIGSGLSGVGLPAKYLIDIIVTSFVYATKRKKVTDKVTLVLPDRLKGVLDLNAIKRSWT